MEARPIDSLRGTIQIRQSALAHSSFFRLHLVLQYRLFPSHTYPRVIDLVPVMLKSEISYLPQRRRQGPAATTQMPQSSPRESRAKATPPVLATCSDMTARQRPDEVKAKSMHIDCLEAQGLGSGTFSPASKALSISFCNETFPILTCTLAARIAFNLTSQCELWTWQPSGVVSG